MDRSLDSSSLTSLETMPSPDVKDQMPSVQMRSATSNQNLPREISKVVTSNYPSSSLSESSVTLSTGMKMSQYPGVEGYLGLMMCDGFGSHSEEYFQFFTILLQKFNSYFT